MEEKERTPLLDKKHKDGKQLSLCMSVAMGIVVMTGGALIAGITYGIFGATLPDLALLLGTSIEEMSTIFIWNGFGGLVGCIICGAIFSRYHSFLVMFINTFLVGVFQISFPWSPNLIVLTFIAWFGQFFNGVVSVGTTFQCFHYWGANGHFMVQVYQLLYNSGKALAPIMAAPFLANENIQGNITGNVSSYEQCPPLGFYENKSKDAYMNVWNNSESEQDGRPKTGVQYGRPETGVQYVYLMLGVALITVSFFYLLIYFLTRKDFVPQVISKTTMKDFLKNSYTKEEIVLLSSATIFSFLYGGMEMNFTGLLLSWVTESLQWSKTIGVALTFYYQIVKIIVNIIAIITSKFVSSWVIYLCDIIVVVLATSMMVVFYGTSFCAISIWITIGFIAFSTSTMHAAAMGAVNLKVEFSGFVSSLFIGAYGMGTMVFPPLTTFLFSSFEPIAFMYVTLVQSLALVITFIMITFIISRGKSCKALVFTNETVFHSTEKTIS